MGSSLNFVFDKLYVEKVTKSKTFFMIFWFFKKYFSTNAFHLMCKWLCLLADVLLTNVRLRLEVLVMSLYSGAFNYQEIFFTILTRSNMLEKCK
jgi:hypothetical protein